MEVTAACHFGFWKENWIKATCWDELHKYMPVHSKASWKLPLLDTVVHVSLQILAKFTIVSGFESFSCFVLILLSSWNVQVRPMHSSWADVYNSSFSSETKVSVFIVRHNVSICFVTWVEQCCSSGDLTMLPIFLPIFFVSQKISVQLWLIFFLIYFFILMVFQNVLGFNIIPHFPLVK